MLGITVVTPWMNHRELERDYWAAMRVADVEAIVVDNASEPALPNAWRLDYNAGFSQACNIGLELARTDAVLFLNNDIQATRQDWAEPIRELLEPGVLVGNISYHRHGDVDGHPLPYIDGWCLAGMRDDLLELGGFDEGYEEPSYFGDNDLCLRARLAGMTLKQADIGLVHLANRTAGAADTPAVQAATESNRRRFAERAREALEGVTA